MKKQTKKRQTSSSQTKRSNTYQLDDYRNRQGRSMPQSDNPYRNPYNTPSGDPRRQSQNPYRTQYPHYEEPQRYQSQSPEAMRQEIKKKNKMTRKELEKIKKRQKRLFMRRLVAIGCIVLFSTYGIVKLVDLMRYPSISFQVVQQGVIDNSKEQEGIIVREESVITSNRTGNVHYIIGEGERVAKSGNVCFVADDAELEKALGAMSALDENLYNLQDKRNDYSYFQSELHLLNNEIKNEMNAFYYTKYWEQPNELYNLRKQLERIIQERTSIYVSDTTEMTQELQANRLNLQNQLNQYQSVATSNKSGIVSYTIDGFETLNFENLETMNYTLYKEALKQSRAIIPQTTIYTENEAPLYKLISDDTWKLVTYLPAQEAEAYEVGKYYKIFFKEAKNRSIQFKLSAMTVEEDQVKCVFETTEKIADYLSARQVGFYIGENKAEGLKIPLKAIVEKNIMPIPSEYIVRQGQEQGVYRVNGQEIQFAPINIQYSDDTYTYMLQRIDQAQTVQLGQTIQHPGTKETFTLTDVSIVRGVYVINGSYAKFKPITVALINEEYAILEENRKTGVKEFDQIISNPQKIREDQLLKYMDVQNK